MSGPWIPGDNAAQDVLGRVRDLWNRLPGWGKAAAVCVPVLIVIVLTATVSGGGNTIGNSSARVSGDPADWRASVCDSDVPSVGLDALVEGIDAADLAVCTTSDASAGSVYVVSGRYASQGKLDNYLRTAFQGNPYAATPADNGGVWAFVAFVDGIGRGKPEVALKPLREFGFQIHTTSGASRSTTSSPTSSYSPPPSQYLPTTAPPPTSNSPNPNANLTPTSRAILSAQPGDCIGRKKGRNLGNGSTEVVVVGAVCGGADSTDMVTVVMYTDQPTCADWVRSRAVTPPKVLCLKPTP